MKQVKLTAAQQKVMDIAKQEIDNARNHTIEQWACRSVEFEYEIEDCRIVKNAESYGLNHDKAVERVKERITKYIEKMGKYYYNECQGIVLTRCSSKTLEKLEQYGLIEIIEDSKGQYMGIDVVKVLNY